MGQVPCRNMITLWIKENFQSSDSALETEATRSCEICSNTGEHRALEAAQAVVVPRQRMRS